MRHPILKAKVGDHITIGQGVHEITDIISVQNHKTVPVPRVLVWTQHGEKKHLLVATFFAQDNQEFLGYTPVWGITATATGFRYLGTDYFPESDKERLWNSPDKATAIGIYECINKAGARLLVIRHAGKLLGFNGRTRYNPSAVQ